MCLHVGDFYITKAIKTMLKRVSEIKRKKFMSLGAIWQRDFSVRQRYNNRVGLRGARRNSKVKVVIIMHFNLDMHNKFILVTHRQELAANFSFLLLSLVELYLKCHSCIYIYIFLSHITVHSTQFLYPNNINKIEVGIDILDGD